MAINLTNIEEYLLERIREISPNANLAPGGAIRDLLVSPLIPILQPLANEIHRIRKNQSLLNAENMTEDDLEALLANLFISRKTGGKATGVAQVMLKQPITTTIPAGTIFTSGGGLQFFAIRTVVTSSSNLVPNPTTGRYEVDVDVEAKDPGVIYNIGKGNITGIVSSNTNIIGARNDAAFSGGTDSEDNRTLLARAEVSLGSRTLATQRGAGQIIGDAFTFVQDVNLVGYGDEDMIRDKIYAPKITIDGVEYPESDGIHMGGKIDIYVLTGLLQDEVHLANTGDGGAVGSGDNSIGLYAGSDQGVQFEGTTDGDGVLCDTSSKPIVDIIGVSLDETTLALPEYAAIAFEEDKDFVFTSKSPGKSNSMDEEKKIQFVRGAGRVEGITYNASYVDDEGNYFTFDYLVNTEYQSFPDFRSSEYLYVMGGTHEEIASAGLINTAQAKDGGGALDISPERGVVSITNASNNTQLLRNIHVTTGRDKPTVRQIIDPTAGVYSYTICGWINLRTLPPEASPGAPTPKRTLINIHGTTLHQDDVSFNEASREDILHIYIDRDGRVNFDTKSVNFPLVQHRSAANQGGSTLLTADGEAGVNNWVFLAFTYNSALQRKDFFFGNYKDVDLHYGVWEGAASNPGIVQPDYDDFGTQMTVGTVDTGEYQIYLSENQPEFQGTGVVQVFDGLIDNLQIYNHALTYTQLNEIFKNVNTATIFGVENTTILDALQPLWDGDVGAGAHPFMFGGIIQMIDGDAAGSEFQIVHNTQPVIPDAPTSITVRANGQASVSRIKDGDKYAVLPRLMEYQIGGSPGITNIAGEIVPVGGGQSVGDEVSIGVGVDLAYYHGDRIQNIQSFVELEETRPANVDFLVKHCFPVFISGDIRCKTNGVVSEDELLASIQQYITSLGVGTDFVISEFVNHMFSIGITYVELPIDLTFAYRDVFFQKFEKEKVDDIFTASRNQYYVPTGIEISII